MNKALYLMGISGLAVILFATLKVLSEESGYSWGIFISALVFVFALVYWFILVSKRKQES